jgi:Fe-S cluster assembly iron-binding protein IscA
MNEPIEISTRAAESVRQYIEQSQRLQDALRATVEALAAQQDVPQNWRFDTQTMTFVPPATNREEVPPSIEPDPNE